jgi:hypothetical protein
VNHADTGSAGIERHVDAGGEQVDVKTDRGAHAQLRVSFINDRDRGLAVTEVVGDRFESEE